MRARSPADPRQRLDLHLHSLRSDGALSPEELLARCAAARLDCMALTDHDQPPALAQGWHELAGHRLYVIHGVELSVQHDGAELHLLCYFPGPMPADFAEFLRARSRERAERYDQALQRMGFPDVPPADEAARRGERALTRHHLAGALVAAGKARRFTEAMERYAGPQAGLVPALSLSAAEGIAAAQAAGALVSWAHPSEEQLRRWLKELARLGLNAVEACRPGLGPLVRGRMMRAAHEQGLLVTGGSDWHGWGGSVGAFSFPWREAEPLLRRLDRGRDMASASTLA